MLNEAIAILIIRIFLGILFFFQGYDKIFKIKMSELIRTSQMELAASGIPKWTIVLGAYYTSFIELFGGIMLIVGLFKSYALYALGLDLVLVAFAMSKVQPMWNMEFVFPRLLLLLLLLFLPIGWDLLSLDYLFNLR